MEYKGYREYIIETIGHTPYGIAIFPENIAKVLTEQFAIPFEQAKKVTNVNLKRLADKEEIERLQKGIYYKAKLTVFGKTKPNMDTVMSQILTLRDEDIIGYETGASFHNSIGLITLMPRMKEIATNRYRTKMDVNCHIITRKPVTRVDKNNYKYLQFLDTVDELPTAYVDAENPYQLLNDYVEKQNLDKLKLIYIAKEYYPQKTLLRLLDIILEVEHETA